MAESGIKEIGVDLIKDSVEVIPNCPNSDSWSLGCDITIDDINAELQEIRVADIILSGNITTGEITVDIDSQKEVIDLGVSAIVNGINSALTESQIVPYENILKITTISPEATNETRYASSAFSAKAIYDLITSVCRRVDTLESTNEQGGVINKEVADRLDKLEKNQFFERYDDQTIKTKYNLFSDHEISAFGLNAGTGGGSGGEGGASYLKDLWDVTIVSAANDDILVYNGTHWVNKPQSSIMPDLSVLNNYLLKTEAAELYLVKDAAKNFASASSVTDLSNALVKLSETYGDRLNALEKIVQWFHLTQDEQAIYTEKNFYSEKEISAHGLNLGGGSGEGGVIELGNIIGVSLHSPVTGDVFVYNGTHWTNISQSELVPDLSGYATTDSVSTVSNKVKSLEDRLNDLESEKFFFKLEGADDVIYTPYNLFSEKEISAHGLNYGSGSGASGLLTDLLDVKAEDSTRGDLLVFDGTHWINTPQSAIVPSIDTSVIATRDWVGQNYASTSDLSNGVKDAKAYTDALRRHVNEQDQILSGQISKILDWFSLEDGVLLTKYNLASEKEVSAKGINASQGGGTSYNRLDSWSAYDSSKAGYVLSALLGYDLHSRVTNLENAEVDLSDYYTKSQTNSQIASAIGAIDLSPYATKAALSTLQGQHDNLRSEFDALNNLLSSDTTDYINTWNEVVAFLDGYKDESDLATILSGMNANIASRHKTEDFNAWVMSTYNPLATRVGKNETSIEDLEERLGLFERVIHIDTEERTIGVDYDFYSTEEISAHGLNKGEGGGGGGSSYSRLDTWDGYDNNKAGYVLSAGLGYGLKVAVDELNGYDLDNRVRSIENSYVSKDAGGVVNGGLVVSSLAIAGGSSSQFLKADGSLDSTSYLPTSGGVVSGLVYIKSSGNNPLQIFSSSGVQSGTIWYVNDTPKSWFGYDANGTNIYDYAHAASLGIATDGVPKFNNHHLLHSGNIGSHAMQYYGTNMPSNIVNYVGYGKPAEGWDNFGPAISFGYGAYYAQMQMASNGSIFSRISWEGNNTDWKTIAFTDSNITGNAASATKLQTARTIWGQSFDGTGNVDGDIELLSANKLYWADKNNYYIGTSYTLSNDGLNLDYRAFAGHVFMSSSGKVRMLINSAGNVTIGDSDYAGASRRLYVDGYVKIAINKTYDILLEKAFGDVEGAGIGFWNNGWQNATISASTLYLNAGSSMGNVLIGTTTDNGAKLQVANNGNAVSQMSFTNNAMTGFVGVDDGGLFMYHYANKDIRFHTYGAERMRITSGGNVLIGTATGIGGSYGALLAKGTQEWASIFYTDNSAVMMSHIHGYGALITSKSYDSGKYLLGVNYNDTNLLGSGYTAFVVKDNGTVGIGTNSPQYTLDINGTLNAGATTLSSLSVSSDIVTNRIIIGGVTLSTEDGVLKIESDMYATGEISAHGLNKGESGGGGSSYSRLDTWIGYDSSKAGYVLSAYLGDDLNTRLSSLSGVVDTHTSRLSSLENAGYITSSALSGYLPLTGGTITGDTDALKIMRNANGYSAITYYNTQNGEATLLGVMGFDSNGEPSAYRASDNTWRTIIHSGNIGSQSVAYATNAGGIQGSTSSINFARGHNRLEMINNPSSYIGDFVSAYQSGISVITEYVGWQMTSYGGDIENPYFRSLEDTGRWKPWRKLAFIDDNVAGAQKLVDGSGNPIIHNSGATFYIGDTIFPTIPTHILGSEIVLRYGASATNGLILDSSGNVTVGNGYFAGGRTKLYVDGGIRFTPRTIWGQSFDGTGDVSGNITLDKAIGINLDDTWTDNSGNTHPWYGLDFTHIEDWTTLSSYYGLALKTGSVSIYLKSSGNVGIGIDSPQYKLHVDGTGYFSGALTANGGLTVSGILTVGGASIHPTANNPYFQLYQNNNYWYWQADDNYTYIGGTMSKALRIDQDGNTLIRGSLGVDALLTASNGLTVSGLSTLTGGIATNDIHGNGQTLYLGNAGNNAYIKVREDMSGVDGAWSIPRNGNAVFNTLTVNGASLFRASVAMEAAVVLDSTLTVSDATTLSSLSVSGNTELQGDLRLRPSGKDFGSSLKFGDGSFCCIQEDTDDHMKVTARHGVTFESSEGTITIPKLSVGINGMAVNGPATFNDFIYSSSITPKTDNYYVLGNNNYKWYAVTAYNVNVHDAITIEAGKELRFKDNNGVVHTLKYDSDKEAFVFDGNVNATGEVSAKRLNA